MATIESLRTIAVNGSRGTATGFELLARVPALDILHAQDSSITDEALASIVAVQPKLRWLYLQRTQVTDVGLAHLVRLKSLQWVYLNGTKVTASGLAGFRKARPDIKTVESDIQDDEIRRADPKLPIITLPTSGAVRAIPGAQANFALDLSTAVGDEFAYVQLPEGI